MASIACTQQSLLKSLLTPPPQPVSVQLDQLLRTSTFKDHCCLDWTPLHTLGIDDYFKKRLPIQWQRLFTIECQQYKELVLEFYITYSFSLHTNDMDASCMKFRLAGSWYNLSLRQFALSIGIYTEPEIAGTLGEEVEISEAQRTDLWRSLTNLSSYSSHNCKASLIIDPRVRILHRMISMIFYGRLPFSGDVLQDDHAILYAFINNKQHCPARALANAFTRHRVGLTISAIYGGSFITRLAMGLGILSDDLMHTLTSVRRVRHLSLTVFRNIGTAAKINGQWRLTIRLNKPCEVPSDIDAQIVEDALITSPDSHPQHDIPDSSSHVPSQSYFEDLKSRLGGLELGLKQILSSQEVMLARQNQMWTRQEEMWSRQEQMWRQQQRLQSDMHQFCSSMDSRMSSMFDLFQSFASYPPPPPPEP